MKKIISALLPLLLILSLAACSAKQKETNTSITSNITNKGKEPLVVETTADSIETTVHKISDKPLDAETYTDNFDPHALAVISKAANEVVSEIKKSEKTDNIKKFTNTKLNKYKSTDSYKTLISVDLALVKPSYYIMNKSGKNGLFEKVLCMAIADVTGVKVKEDSDAKEYIALYNKTANKAVKNFNEIMLKDITEEEKLLLMKDIGIFAVAQLLEQMDAGNISYSGALDCIVQIVKEKTGEDPSEDFAMWRADNEVNYRNILDTL